MVRGFYRRGDGVLFAWFCLIGWLDDWIMGFPPKVRVIELVGMVRSLRWFLLLVLLFLVILKVTRLMGIQLWGLLFGNLLEQIYLGFQLWTCFCFRFGRMDVLFPGSWIAIWLSMGSIEFLRNFIVTYHDGWKGERKIRL